MTRHCPHCRTTVVYPHAGPGLDIGPCWRCRGEAVGRFLTSLLGRQQYLYGLPGAELLHSDPAECYENDIEPYIDVDSPTVAGEAHVIEKWTAEPAADYLPNIDRVTEWIAEHASEDMGAEEADDQWHEAAKDKDVLAAFQAAAVLMASKVSWLMCGEKVGDLIVTWDDEGKPQLNGQPMYVRGAAWAG